MFVDLKNEINNKEYQQFNEQMDKIAGSFSANYWDYLYSVKNYVNLAYFDSDVNILKRIRRNSAMIIYKVFSIQDVLQEKGDLIKFDRTMF